MININPVTFLDNVLIPHKAFQTATDRIELFVGSAHEMSQPVCLALLGPQGSGKSSVLEFVFKRHPRVRHDDGLVIPIVRVTVPPKPTIKGLGEEILKEMDEYDDRRYTEGQQLRRIQTLMRNCGTIVLMLDEFQHFYDKRSHVVWHYVADWLKVLVDSVGCVLVVSGLPECTAVIEQNPQLARRFRAPLRMPRFSWRNETQRDEFIACLEAFHDVMVQHLNIPILHDEEWAFRTYCATGGLIGYLKVLLSELLLHARTEKKTKMTLEDFDVAFTNYLYSMKELHGLTLKPFSRNFEIVATHDVLEAVARIGATEPCPSSDFGVTPRSPRKKATSLGFAAKGAKG